MPGLSAELLQELDARGVSPLIALHPVPNGRRADSLARPFPFVCSDGKTYWLKVSAQWGLVVELIAGRLAFRTLSGPNAQIVQVPQLAVEGRLDLTDFVGTVVGIEEQPRTINSKDLAAFIQAGGRLPAQIDPMSRAQVAAFRTWLKVGDDQVLIALDDGKIYSIDHGDAFNDLRSIVIDRVISPHIDGIESDVGRDVQFVEPSVDRIEDISDEILMLDVARTPTEPSWQSEPARRLSIARWLSQRRPLLREAMMEWCQH